MFGAPDPSPVYIESPGAPEAPKAPQPMRSPQGGKPTFGKKKNSLLNRIGGTVGESLLGKLGQGGGGGSTLLGQ